MGLLTFNLVAIPLLILFIALNLLVVYVVARRKSLRRNPTFILISIQALQDCMGCFGAIVLFSSGVMGCTLYYDVLPHCWWILWLNLSTTLTCISGQSLLALNRLCAVFFWQCYKYWWTPRNCILLWTLLIFGPILAIQTILYGFGGFHGRLIPGYCYCRSVEFTMLGRGVTLEKQRFFIWGILPCILTVCAYLAIYIRIRMCRKVTTAPQQKGTNGSIETIPTTQTQKGNASVRARGSLALFCHFLWYGLALLPGLFVLESPDAWNYDLAGNTPLWMLLLGLSNFGSLLLCQLAFNKQFRRHFLVCVMNRQVQTNGASTTRSMTSMNLTNMVNQTIRRPAQPTANTLPQQPAALRDISNKRQTRITLTPVLPQNLQPI